jgi:hypothetical protein
MGTSADLNILGGGDASAPSRESGVVSNNVPKTSRALCAKLPRRTARAAALFDSPASAVSRHPLGGFGFGAFGAFGSFGS